MEHQHSPSVFELLACDNLKSGLREALRYLIDKIYQTEALRQIKNKPKSDEAILLLDLLIEYNYLRSYNASFAEKLYNLMRLNRKDGSKINNIYPSVICLVLVPYLTRKLNKYFEDLNYKQTRTADELKRIRIYKIISNSGSLLNLVCLIRLAAGKSNYHNFLDFLLNVKLMGRCDETDGRNNLTFIDKLSKAIADLMGRSLTVGSYIIQFLDYWNTHSNSTPIFNVSLPIPEPPERDSSKLSSLTNRIGGGCGGGDDFDRLSNICLICLHVRQNECALSNTGYVFCYSCLQKYVTTKQTCPVTGYPTNSDNIIKLFSSSTT